MRRAPAARAAFGAALLALALSSAACGGSITDGAVGPRGGATGGTGVGGGSESALAQQLVGRWDRVLYFYDDLGDLLASETVWTFAPDGAAARTVYSRNLTWGYSDATVTLARWRVEGSDVVITYQPPDAGTARFPASITRQSLGDVLVLGGIAFDRVAA